VFERANSRSADGDDATRSTESLIDGGGCARGNGIRLRVEFVIFDALDADRLKGSQADVQGNIGGFSPPLADAV